MAEQHEVTTLILLKGPDERRQNITPREGEILYVTDTKRVFIGDGESVGGVPLGGGTGDGLDPTDIEDWVQYYLAQTQHDDLGGVDPNEHVNHETVLISAGNGLTGTGDITSSVTIDMGTPGTLSADTQNQLYDDSHTHSIATTDDRNDGSETRLLVAKALKDHIDNDIHGSEGEDHTHSHSELEDVDPYEHINHNDVEIQAGNGLDGGGNLSETRTISLKTPGTLSANTNNVSNEHHTHKITATDRRDVLDDDALLLAKALKDHIDEEPHFNMDEVAWDDIQNKPELYNKTEVDDKLANKAVKHHDHDDVYLAKNQNLHDLDNKLAAFQYITDANDAYEGQILSLDEGGVPKWTNVDDINVSWDTIADKPDLYNKSEIDSKLDDKASSSYVQDTYLAKNQNLHDLDNKLAAFQYITNADDAYEGQILSLDEGGIPKWTNVDDINVSWDTIADKPELYNKTEVDDKLANKAVKHHDHDDVYLAKNQNLHDLDNKLSAFHYLTDANDAYEGQILSLDEGGVPKWTNVDDINVSWDIITNKPELYTKSEVDGLISDVEIDELGWDKITNKPELYDKSEVDGLLSNKASSSYVQDNYVAKTQNLEDLDDKLSAFQHLTNANTSLEGKFLSLDNNAHPQWKSVDDINVSWDTLSDKPDTATRWPQWGEVDDKPELYDKSEVDGLLSNKASSSYVQDNYLAKDQNLADLNDKMSAFQELTNANSSLEGKFLTLDSNGNPQWDEVQIDTSLLHEHTIDNDFSNGYGKRYVSTEEPTNDIGNEGDIWLQYE